MRKFSFLALSALLAVCLFSFTACSDDDDVSADEITDNIVGTWQTTHIQGYWYDDTTDETIIKIDEDVTEENMERLQFTASGMCMHYRYYSLTGTWLHDDTGYYAVQDDKIVISDEDGEYIGYYKVISLSGEQMVIESYLDEGTQYPFRITLKRV